LITELKIISVRNSTSNEIKLPHRYFLASEVRTRCKEKNAFREKKENLPEIYFWQVFHFTLMVSFSISAP